MQWRPEGRPTSSLPQRFSQRCNDVILGFLRRLLANHFSDISPSAESRVAVGILTSNDGVFVRIVVNSNTLCAASATGKRRCVRNGIHGDLALVS